MESHVFQKARTRDEYMTFIAKLIIHVRGMGKFDSSVNFRTDFNENPEGVSMISKIPESEVFAYKRFSELIVVVARDYASERYPS